MSLVENYRDLEIWKMGMDVTESIYKLTEFFPSSELYGLTSQMRRSAVSIPSNIAEGFARRSPKEMRHFLNIAHGSIAELETHLTLTRNLGHVSADQHDTLLETLDHLGRKITLFAKRL